MEKKLKYTCITDSHGQWKWEYVIERLAKITEDVKIKMLERNFKYKTKQKWYFSKEYIYDIVHEAITDIGYPNPTYLRFIPKDLEACIDCKGERILYNIGEDRYKIEYKDTKLPEIEQHSILPPTDWCPCRRSARSCCGPRTGHHQPGDAWTRQEILTWSSTFLQESDRVCDVDE